MVAKQYICDRCGKEKKGHIHVDVPINTSKKVVQDAGWIAIHCPTGYKMNLELCEDCMKEFASFMHGDFNDPNDMNKFEP